jgi:hypothetical protein
MSDSNPVLSSKTNYTREFENRYARTFEVPTSVIKQCTFHPTLLDHLVVISEIHCPRVSTENIKVLKHNFMDDDDFASQITDRYMKEAERQVAKRGNKLTRTMTFHKDVGESNSMPEEPSSQEWEYSESILNEGGAETLQKKLDNLKKSPKKRKAVVKRDNEIFINRGTKVKGSYPKVKSEATKIREQNEKSTKAESYNRACDLFFKEKGYFFDYQAYDESMIPHEEEVPLAKHYSNNNIEHPRMDLYSTKEEFDFEYKPSEFYMGYEEIPEYDGLKYIPPLFREKYEISIWKVDIHNSVKVKSTYFTPDVSFIFF